MKWMMWFGRILVHSTSPQELVDISIALWPQLSKQIPPTQRVDFLHNAAEKSLGVVLADLDRTQRAALMNSLLPQVVQEFPLNDLDLLTAFSRKEDRN